MTDTGTKQDRSYVRDRELLDLIEHLEEVDDHLIDARGYVPDNVIDLTNDAHAALNKAVVYLCKLRERCGGAP
jgi:hypothetical protein